EMGGAAVERDALDAAMGGVQDGAARRLIDAAALHADEAVLDQIEPADAVGLAEFVEPRQQRRRRQLLAVDRHGIAALELDLDIGRLVRRRLRGNRALIDELLRLVPWILQRLALAGAVPQGGTHREWR